MASMVHEELSRAEELSESGKYEDALGVVGALAAREDLTEDDQLARALLESRLRLRLGEPSEGLALAEKALQTARGRMNPLIVADLLIVRAESSWRTGKLDEALAALEEGEGLLAEARSQPAQEPRAEIERRKAGLLRQRGIVHWYRGELDRALECHQQGLAIHGELGNKRGIGDAFNNMGLVWQSKGNLEPALEHYQKGLVIFEELDDRRRIATSLSNMGNVYSIKGDLPSALECHEQSLAIREELGLNHDVLHSLINLGVLYQLKGDLERALQYYRRGLAISEEVGTRRGIALALGNLGEVHRLKGDLTRALEYYQRSLSIYDELGARQDVARMLGNIGETHRQKGSPTRALEYYQRSLALNEEIGDKISTAGVLRQLIAVALDGNDRALAQEQLQKLQRLNERADNRVIDQNYRVARALWLKTTARARHKVEAQQILEELVEEDIADHSLTVIAMIHLCDLLLSELRMTGEEEVLGEVKNLTHRLHDIAIQQSSHSLLAETYLLQSKLALMELDVGQARELLVQAHTIADEKGLERLARAVASERESLQSQLHRWEAIVEQNPPKRDIVDLTGIDDLLERMVQKTVATLVDDRGVLLGREVSRRRYSLVHVDLLKDASKAEKSRFRVGIAQIGLSHGGEILQELYTEQSPGLFRLREDMVEPVRSKLKEMVERASAEDVNILVFPELTIDLGSDRLREDVVNLAKAHNMYLIPGSYHDEKARRNVSTVVSPDGILWEQTKHIPAVIRSGGKTLTEGIASEHRPREIAVGNTEFGRIAIVICRDFLDMDLRVELKNCEPPVDLLINPAFTPVTADFRAAHFDARRSVFAYCFFANVAEFGDSLIYTPEKERTERNIPAKEESLIYKDVDLFRLRSERKKWEIEQTKRRAFIQSTRHG